MKSFRFILDIGITKKAQCLQQYFCEVKWKKKETRLAQAGCKAKSSAKNLKKSVAYMPKRS
jgi:hypothetical protein